MQSTNFHQVYKYQSNSLNKSQSNTDLNNTNKTRQGSDMKTMFSYVLGILRKSICFLEDRRLQGEYAELRQIDSEAEIGT